MVEVEEICYQEDEIGSDEEPDSFDEADIKRLRGKFGDIGIQELDYGAYELDGNRPAAPPRPCRPGSIPFIDDDRVPTAPPRPPPPKGGFERRRNKKSRFSVIRNAFDGLGDGDFKDIINHIHKLTGEKGLEHNWSNSKVQELTEKMIAKAAHKFLKVDRETGRIIGSIAGNVIFHTGGRDNKLGNVGKVVLDNMITGKFRRKVDAFKHDVVSPTGVESLGIDFYRERERCLRSKTLFEDPEFAANSRSLYYRTTPSGRIQWRRPGEIVKDPQLIVEGHTRFDVVQGVLGDCWLLAAIANITLRDELFYRVVPPDQSFTENYAGIFHFQFWRYGKWVDVVIDDRLPTENGKLIYMHSDSQNEFWSALLEKAYAKMYGCYECLDGGLTVEALEDMTGGLSEHFDLRKMDRATVLAMLVRGFQTGSLFGCSLDPDPNIKEAVMYNGLVRGHAYSITAVQTVNTFNGEIVLLRIRNPWGNHKEWFGAWSDGSREWNTVSDVEKTKLDIRFSNDGEFWMSFDDYFTTFEVMEICHLPCDVLKEIEDMTGVDSTQLNDTGRWYKSQSDGSWSRNLDTAGGCINYITSFPRNPQFLTDLSVGTHNVEGDGKCTVIVAVLQKFRRELRNEGKENLPIGFSVYNAGELTGSRLDEKFFRSHKSVARVPVYMNMREVTARFRVPPGKYVIVPSTFEPYQNADFLVRVFANGPVNIRML